MRSVSWLLVLSGCYAPVIADGQYQCGVAAECPEGFYCTAGGQCFAIGHAWSEPPDLRISSDLPDSLPVNAADLSSRFPDGLSGGDVLLPDQAMGDTVSGIDVRLAELPDLAAAAPDRAALPDVLAIPDLLSCDPFADSCGSGLACYVSMKDGSTACFAPGTRGTSTDCNRSEECARGYACSSLVGQCLPLCWIANPIQCRPGIACKPMPGGIYGTCT